MRPEHRDRALQAERIRTRGLLALVAMSAKPRLPPVSFYSKISNLNSTKRTLGVIVICNYAGWAEHERSRALRMKILAQGDRALERKLLRGDLEEPPNILTMFCCTRSEFRVHNGGEF